MGDLSNQLHAIAARLQMRVGEVLEGEARRRASGSATKGESSPLWQQLRGSASMPDMELLDVLTPVPGLRTATSEKGSRRRDRRCDPDSVFGLVDGLRGASETGPSDPMAKHFGNLQMLVCTDMGKEIADFIAVQPGRIAFIHAKADDGKRVSASTLHEVVSQAIKNLLWLQPLNTDSPVKPSWDEDWRNTTDGRTQLVKRLRVGKQRTGAELWSYARSVITDPSADREVWLVLGAALSASAVRDAVDNPTPELIQIYALLQTAWGAISQTGARLRVFCSP